MRWRRRRYAKWNCLFWPGHTTNSPRRSSSTWRFVETTDDWLKGNWRFDHLQEFVDSGGALMVLLGEGGEHEFNTNINFLLEDYGMTINNGSFGVDFTGPHLTGFLSFQIQSFEHNTSSIFIRRRAWLGAAWSAHRCARHCWSRTSQPFRSISVTRNWRFRFEYRIRSDPPVT